MAHEEADRENLMQEATGFPVRGEFRLSDEQVVFIGFREDGRFAFYFDQNPVYQFDGQGAIRRAFVDGLLYRTQGKTISVLERARTEEETYLNRSDLNDEMLSEFFHHMDLRLNQLGEEISTHRGEWLEILDEEHRFESRVITACQVALHAEPRLAKSISARNGG